MVTKRSIALAIALVVAGVAGGSIVVAAQPQPPAAYYGSVTVGGDPAPTGVTIQALVDGDVVDEITVSEEGTYGGPAPTDEKLLADCDCSGDVVEFRLKETGEVADTTVVWESGDVQQVDLSFPNSDVEGDSSNENSDDSDGDNTSDDSDGDNTSDDSDGDNTSDDSDGDNSNDGADNNDGDDGDNNAGSSSSGGGGGGGGASSADESSVRVTELDRGVTVSIDVQSNDDVEADLDGAVSSDGVSVDALQIEHLITPDDYRIEIDNPQAESPDGTPELEGAEAIGYFRAEAIGASSDEVDGATFTFSVSDSTLPSDTDADAVTLFRYADGEWQALETQLVDSSGDENTFEAESSGLSYFAVGVQHADLSVTDAALSDTEVSPGDTVSVDVTVENDGDIEGTKSIEVQFDGETVSSTEVTVEAGSSKTVTMTVPVDEAGEYTVVVDGVEAGTVLVEESETAAAVDDSHTETTSQPVEEEFGVNVPGFGPGIALVALLIASLLARRRSS